MPTSSKTPPPKGDGEHAASQKPAAPIRPVFDRAWLVRLGVQSAAVLVTLLVVVVTVGLAQRIGWLRPSGGAPAERTAAAGAGIVYTCPMHPEIRLDAPGKCPKCGMTLVPVSTGQEQTSSAAPQSSGAAESKRYVCPMMCTPPLAEPGRCPTCDMNLVEISGGYQGDDSIAIDPVARRIAGIRTAEASEEEVFRTIRTVGQIQYDEERVATIAAYVDGRLEELYAEYVGVPVAKGDHLAVLYSPQLYTAQVAFLSSLSTPALDAMAGRGERFSSVTRDNLVELGMTAAQIDQLQQTGEAKKRLRIASPIGGTVIAKYKVEGDYIQRGEPIYRVVDLSTVWLMLDLYPSDAAAVRFGQEVEAEVQSLPGEFYKGRVAFVDPIVDDRTQTVAVRVEMPNVDRRLKPGDYATATIRVPAIHRERIYDPDLAGKWISPMHPQIIRDNPGQCPICGMDLVPTSELGFADEPLSAPKSVVVPRSAVLMAGDNSVVYVETAPGVFELRRVSVAALTDAEAAIGEGLAPGETVAVDGNFLIDSQMQLAGKPSLLDPTRGKTVGETEQPPAEVDHAH